MDIYDPIVESLQAEGTPVTRKNYLDLAYPAPPDWDAELESMLPESLQDWDNLAEHVANGGY